MKSEKQILDEFVEIFGTDRPVKSGLKTWKHKGGHFRIWSLREMVEEKKKEVKRFKKRQRYQNAQNYRNNKNAKRIMKLDIKLEMINAEMAELKTEFNK
jgi:hypothetical protein